jgi:hypothetical protein
MKNTYKISSALFISMLVYSCSQSTLPPLAANDATTLQFSNVSDKVGLNTVATWKYGGPVIADLNNDDRYDLILINHHVEPAQLWWSNPDNTYSLDPTPIATNDVHGIAAGDYDLDGDNDVLVSLGGGNGSTPQPPHLKQNNQGQFTNVTEEAGISKLGARGRSVRWIDIDRDGDLDMIQITAVQVVENTGPRNIVFENIGNGKFTYRPSPVFEKMEAERVLITNFNNDQYPDLITFTPLAVLAGNGSFEFTNVTKEVLPEHLHDIASVTAATEADIDNDGDMDIYLSRGKTYYEIANNSIYFNAKSQRLDIRDEGNKSHDGISFSANSDVTLSDFFHWPRGVDLNLPVYVGSAQKELPTPADSTSTVTISPENALGFPADTSKNGWYLGYLDNNQWRLEWRLNGDLAWDVRASLQGVSAVKPDWQPQNRKLADILLENQGGTFTDATAKLPQETNDNNWGVISADFNNDQFVDFFVYRFGELMERVPDMLLINDNKGGFTTNFDHGANVLNVGGHGDMGAAFDYNQDGFIDILSGDDDLGKWYLYENQSSLQSNNHYLNVNVGYAKSGVDSLGAMVTVTANGKNWTKRVGSAGAVHSQSVLNQVHFGLAEITSTSKVQVLWRDGSQQTVTNINADQQIKIGK